MHMTCKAATEAKIVTHVILFFSNQSNNLGPQASYENGCVIMTVRNFRMKVGVKLACFIFLVENKSSTSSGLAAIPLLLP